MAGSPATNQTGRTFELTEGQYLALQLDPVMRNYSIEKGMTLQTGPRSVDPGFEIKSPKNIDPGFEIPTKPNPVEDPYYPREQKPSTMTYFYMNPKGGKYDFQAGKGASIVESDSGRPGARKTYELTTNDPAIISAMERNRIPETTDEKAKLRKSMLDYLKPKEGMEDLFKPKKDISEYLKPGEGKRLPELSEADIARISKAFASAMKDEGEKSTSITMTKEQFLTLSDRFPEYTFMSNLVAYIGFPTSYGKWEITSNKDNEKKGEAKEWTDGTVTITTNDPRLIKEAGNVKSTVDLMNAAKILPEHEKRVEDFGKALSGKPPAKPEEASALFKEMLEYARPLKTKPDQPLISPAELYKMLNPLPSDAKKFSLTPGDYEKLLKDPALQDYKQTGPVMQPISRPVEWPNPKTRDTGIPFPKTNTPDTGDDWERKQDPNPPFYLEPKSAKSNSTTSVNIFPNAFSHKPDRYEIRTNDQAVLKALANLNIREMAAAPSIGSKNAKALDL